MGETPCMVIREFLAVSRARGMGRRSFYPNRICFLDINFSFLELSYSPLFIRSVSRANSLCRRVISFQKSWVSISINGYASVPIVMVIRLAVL